MEELLVKPVGEMSASCSADRSGRVTIRELVTLYMTAYTGRDTTRVQRLQFWVAKLGDTPLSELDDDHIFHALEDLAARRGRYFAGHDADGKAIFKAKDKPYAPATINRYGAARAAVLTWAIRRRIAPKAWVSPAMRMERKRENNEIVRYLSDAERIALLAGCNPRGTSCICSC